MNNHGTRSIQALIVKIKDNSSLIQLFFDSIQDQLYNIILDVHGNHIIQSSIVQFCQVGMQSLTPIFNLVKDNCLEVATHKHGCCVLQRCLENGTKEQKQEFGKLISKHINTLIADPFGNYLVQHVFQFRDEQSVGLIIDEIRIRFIELSKQKFSSNVIEKCIEHSQEQTRDDLLKSLETNTQMKELMFDPFGNYGKPVVNLQYSRSYSTIVRVREETTSYKQFQTTKRILGHIRQVDQSYRNQDRPVLSYVRVQMYLRGEVSTIREALRK